jgi:PAP2 superfamily
MARRHSFLVELLLLTLTYVVYDAARGLVRGGAPAAVAHARSIASLERSLGLLHEADLQRAVAHLPGATTLFGFGYDVLHLSVTGGVLLWLYFRHADAYPRVRTTLLAATGLALVGFTIYPSAPPRLAGIGIADTLSLAKDTAQSGVLQFLYNPYAAMPSLHMAYALIAGACLYRWGGHQIVRFIGIAYPVFVGVEVVATGNHFFLDLAAGVAVDICALAIVSRVLTQSSPRNVALETVAPRWLSVASTFREELRRSAGGQFAEMTRDSGEVVRPAQPSRSGSPTGAPSPPWPTLRETPCR